MVFSCYVHRQISVIQKTSLSTDFEHQILHFSTFIRNWVFAPWFWPDLSYPLENPSPTSWATLISFTCKVRQMAFRLASCMTEKLPLHLIYLIRWLSCPQERQSYHKHTVIAWQLHKLITNTLSCDLARCTEHYAGRLWTSSKPVHMCIHSQNNTTGRSLFPICFNNSQGDSTTLCNIPRELRYFRKKCSRIGNKWILPKWPSPSEYEHVKH